MTLLVRYFNIPYLGHPQKRDFSFFLVFTIYAKFSPDFVDSKGNILKETHAFLLVFNWLQPPPPPMSEQLEKKEYGMGM